MDLKKTLFDDNQQMDQSKEIRKEATSLEKLKNLEDKITTAVERVKALKEENVILKRRIKELEELLNAKDLEIGQLTFEKNSVRDQIESLLSELEMIESERE